MSTVKNNFAFLRISINWSSQFVFLSILDPKLLTLYFFYTITFQRKFIFFSPDIQIQNKNNFYTYIFTNSLFINSFIQYLLSNNYVPGTEVGTGGKLNHRGMTTGFMKYRVWWEREKRKLKYMIKQNDLNCDKCYQKDKWGAIVEIKKEIYLRNSDQVSSQRT